MTFKPGQSGNPAGRPRKMKPEMLEQLSRLTERFDGWGNWQTGLGMARDKRQNAWFSTDVVTDIEAVNLWRGDDICRRTIEAPVKTAWRRGFRLKLQDKEQAELTKADLEGIDLANRFVHARCLERACGGAAIYPVLGDGGELEEPLDENAIQKMTALHVLESRELMPVSYYTDINHPKFRQVEYWRLMPLNAIGSTGTMMQVIHESRLIIFPGRRISHQFLAYQRPGWGDSVLTGIYPIIRDFGATWGYVATLMQDFAQAMLSMEGFASLMKEDGGEAIVKARLRLLDEMRSTMRMMVMDKGDTFSRQQTPMAGLSDLLHDFALRIAAACEQPVTVMFGMAPAGLNATGDNDVRGWYDTVSGEREHHDQPRLERLLHLYFLSKDGSTNGTEPDVWSAEFLPLWEPTEKEVAETRLAVAQADKIYAIDIGAATPDDVAESRWKGDTYSPEMVIDWERRAAQMKAEQDMAKQAQDVELAKAKAAANGNGQAPPMEHMMDPGDGAGHAGGRQVAAPAE